MDWQKKFASIFILMILACSTVLAAETMEDLIRYLNLEGKVSQADIAKLAELKERAEAPGLADQQRQDAYKELFTQMSGIQGSHPPEAVMNYMVMTAMSWSCTQGKKEQPADKARPGELGAFMKQGHGKTPVILIPDVGFSGRIFDDFIQRHSADYTMYAVTLPGLGGTPSLPRFERRDYAQRRLWNNAENAVMSLMQREAIQHAVLIGQQAGAYLAMRIALDHPESVRAVVALNGLLYMPVSSAPDASKRADPEFRKKLSEVFLPAELLPRPSQQCYAAYIEKIASMFCRNPEREKALARSAADSDPFAAWDYFVELLTTDLSDEIRNLKVPLLAIPSIPDAEMAQKIPATSLNQWKQVQSPMVTVAPVENSRAYATEDNPEALDRILEKFLQEH